MRAFLATRAARVWTLAAGLALLAAGVALQVIARGREEGRRAGAAPPSVASLAEAARRTDDPEALREVLRALERIGDEESVLLLHRLGTARPEIAADAAVRLSRVEDRAAAPALLAVLAQDGERGPFAAAAARALGRMRLRSAVPRLAAAAGNSADPAVREAAAQALGGIADPDGVPALAALLDDGEARVRRAAIRGLGRIPGPASIAGLETYLARAGAREESEQVLAREALAGLRSPGVGDPRS
jgi:HEAT repeat protein